jgi:hypothetical protein
MKELLGRFTSLLVEVETMVVFSRQDGWTGEVVVDCGVVPNCCTATILCKLSEELPGLHCNILCTILRKTARHPTLVVLHNFPVPPCRSKYELSCINLFTVLFSLFQDFL